MEARILSVVTARCPAGVAVRLEPGWRLTLSALDRDGDVRRVEVLLDARTEVVDGCTALRLAATCEAFEEATDRALAMLGEALGQAFVPVPRKVLWVEAGDRWIATPLGAFAEVDLGRASLGYSWRVSDGSHHRAEGWAPTTEAGKACAEGVLRAWRGR